MVYHVLFTLNTFGRRIPPDVGTMLYGINVGEIAPLRVERWPHVNCVQLL